MTRAIYISGFCNGHKTSDRVGKSLETYYDHVSIFTFSEMLNRLSDIESKLEHYDLITHSAGALVIDKLSVSPNKIIMLNPPLPSSIVRLILQGFRKTARLHIPGKGLHNLDELSTMSRFGRNSLAEFAIHPIANWGQLKNISTFNAVESALSRKQAGIAVNITWTSEDSFFKPSDADLAFASDNKIPVKIVDGEHDELIIRPVSFLKNALIRDHDNTNLI
jgi:hypothetical protein